MVKRRNSASSQPVTINFNRRVLHPAHASTLAELRTIKQLQEELKHIFPTAGSLDWELRRNRTEYIKAGALFEIAGRLMAHPAVFQSVALALGAKRVEKRS